MSRLKRVADKGARTVLRWLRALRGDLLTVRADPLPPSEWLRWVPHGVVCLAAFGIFFGDLDQLMGHGRIGEGNALLVALGQCAAAVLALRRPVPALWLSLTASLAGAVLERRMLMAGQIDGFPWPWTQWGVATHTLVLLLLTLRVPTRAAVVALAVTALQTYVLQGLWGAWNHVSNGEVAVILFALAVVLGSALRGRREARAELLQQTTLTAEERARRTLLEERGRIARELHDVVAHHMSVISIQAQVAPHLVADPSDELKENLAGIRQNAVEALTELRRVLDVLRAEHPAPGERADAPDTTRHAPQPTLDRLGALVENTRAAGLTVTTEISGERRPLPPGVELSAYRIVQEALSNVLRHAPGATAHVALAYDPHGLRVQVVNTGPAREAPPSAGAGHGLLGMRERAVMLGGRLTAGPWAGRGYRVDAYLPASAPPATEPPSQDGTA
ncbi:MULTISPECIES: sensor histidine kinase [unclassified Streptomyces]|uniref:sensor histidine kinase n=1 Tax=unclassified Streptomyces TaxID=2593676 RepID=UPI000F6B3455|nr:MULTISPECIES: sensor histidine kinase [unclassified Streptomyces]AZM61023.1 two-component sensor histidine kinase [Streptomyces sp. WAC 01438]RSM97763.1 two-component sensor histidine kinase [Streptomyces sp. WAC 01420]